MTLVHGISTAIAYILIFGFGSALALVVVGGLWLIVESWKDSRRKPFSLNPEWESTRDYIDAIPTKKDK